MKKVLKILLIVLLVIVANIGILVNTVQAVENGEQITIYSKGYFNRVIRNNGIVIKTAHAVYQENGKEYPVYICGNCSTNRRIIPNFWKGLSLLGYKNDFEDKYDIVYAHTGSCMCAIGNMIDRKKTKLVYHQHGLSYLTDFQMRSLIQRPSFYFAQKYAHLVCQMKLLPIIMQLHMQM